jgi:hypothetical protein
MLTIVRGAFTAQGKADAAGETAAASWVIVADAFKAEYGADWRKYTANPAGKGGVVDNRHSEAYCALRQITGMAAAKDAAEYDRIVAFTDDPDTRGDDNLTGTVLVRGKLEKVQRTKKAWQSWRSDLVKMLKDRTAAAEKAIAPRVPRVPKSVQERIRAHFTAIEAIVQKEKDLPFDAADFLNSLKVINRMV